MTIITVQHPENTHHQIYDEGTISNISLDEKSGLYKPLIH